MAGSKSKPKGKTVEDKRSRIITPTASAAKSKPKGKTVEDKQSEAAGALAAEPIESDAGCIPESMRPSPPITNGDVKLIRCHRLRFVGQGTSWHGAGLAIGRDWSEPVKTLDAAVQDAIRDGLLEAKPEEIHPQENKI